MSDKAKSLQEEIDRFQKKEWPRIRDFERELEKAILLLRRRKISPGDFYERLVNFGDGKRVAVLFVSDGEPYDFTRTAGGNLIIKAQSVSFNIPNMRVWIGLDKINRLTVKKVEAWFVDQETGKRDYVRSTISDVFPSERIPIRYLAREILRDFRNLTLMGS